MSYSFYSDEHEATIQVNVTQTPDGYLVTATNLETDEEVGRTRFSNEPSRSDINDVLMLEA